MEQTRDQPMANNHDDELPLLLSPDEERVVALHDRLQELRLEVAIINAQKLRQPDAGFDATEEDMGTAQNGLLEARANYRLRNDVVNAVMMANPILKAVHSSIEASPIERDLLPYVERRDEAAISVARHASQSTKLRNDLTKVRSETLRISRRNVDLTAQLLELTEEVKRKKAAPLDNPKTEREVSRLEDEVRTSRQRWRVVKGVASAVVAGSGVDWARDDVLCDIVLDPVDEEW